MNTSEMNELRNELDSAIVTVHRSVFRDRNGFWAKEWVEVDNVYVQTGIASPTKEFVLTPEEFKSLSREQQTKIRNAPSSPLP